MISSFYPQHQRVVKHISISHAAHYGPLVNDLCGELPDSPATPFTT